LCKTSKEETDMNRLPVLALAAAAALVAAQASAHAKLAKSEPAANASGAAPSAIKLEFNEKLSAKFSGVQLMRNDTGANVQVAPAASKDPKALVVQPKAPLKPGSYMVMWYAVGDDGHRTNGDYNFTVK
jgi:methionine-rich copper-binding protein CopC